MKDPAGFYGWHESIHENLRPKCYTYKKYITSLKKAVTLKYGFPHIIVHYNRAEQIPQRASKAEKRGWLAATAQGHTRAFN